jgi:hypothetical protein
MAQRMTDSKRSAKPKGGSRPYAPSWIDRFDAWVDRLPGPSWPYYLGLALVLFAAQAATLWLEGAFDIGALAVLGFLTGMIAFFLILCHDLNARADSALATLRPILKADEKAYGELRYQVTTLPALPTLLASLIALGVALTIEAIGEGPYRVEALDPFAVSSRLLRVVYLVCWAFFGVFIYHTVHQLRQVYGIYTKHTQIDLFRMGPLYAFSGVAALSAVGLTIPPYGFTILAAVPLTQPSILIVILPITLLALLAFIWPMLGAHRLLVEEKGRLLQEATLRLEDTFVDLHRRVDDKAFEGIDGLNTAMVSLERELKAIGGIPTWPWQPETVRGLVTAVLLPLGLWIVQFVLQSILNT